MRLKINILLLYILLSNTQILLAQDIDTLVDIGGQKMHFNIWEGEGTPILFESGGGNDGMIWAQLIDKLHPMIGTTVITYDRAGYGQSEYDKTLADDKKSLITHGIHSLNAGLTRLGFDKEIILVAHSYGGFYVTKYANQYPDRVLGIVLIDATLKSFYTDEYMEALDTERTEAWLLDIKSKSPPLYYECLANKETIQLMQNISLPAAIPVIDIVAENPPFSKKDNERWIESHTDFTAASSNRIGIIAYDCNHYLHFEHAQIAVNAIVQMYTQVSQNIDYKNLLKRNLTYNIESSNLYRKGEFEYWHSERDLNSWGYTLIASEDLQAALKVLELNTILYPASSNAWDSYGEILLKLDRKEEAIKMYQKSIDLDPNNENGKQLLYQLLNPKK